jgi:SpoIID/LytB domain protein
VPLSSGVHDEAVIDDRVLRLPRRGLAALGVVALVGGTLAAVAQSPVPPGGTLRVGVSQAGGRVRVETFELEDYVARVVSGEGQPRAGRAAQEALAIVIRTFAMANLHRHRAEGYDLCDTTHCQVLRPALPAAYEAARATAGQVLLDQGRPAFVFYSAHNGGVPALASEVWPGATDYAPSHPHDDACADEPGWTSTIATADIERALRAVGATGRHLRALAVVDRTASDRAGRLRLDGFTPPTLTAHEFRMAIGRTLGWQLVRSTAFDVERDGDAYQFNGVGYGHGVGLCVVGAGKRAARGDSVDDILRAYFRDLRVGRISGETALARHGSSSGRPPAPRSPAPPRTSGTTPPVSPPTVAPPVPARVTDAAPDVPLTLAPEDEHERATLVALVRETRDAVAARALIAPPAVIRVTVHPTMEAFARATGQPSWAPASTVGTAIDLAPIAQLRQRGLLEASLRFEVATAVVTPYLTSAPGWVKVGAAMMFAAPVSAPPPPGGRVECPSDTELFRPVSGGAQREAFVRAERCVRRETGRGRALTSLR